MLDAATGDVLCTGEATYMAAGEAQRAELQARYQLRLVPLASDDLALAPVGRR